MSEWIGGRLCPPFFITDRDEPYRPWMVVWMESDSGLVVGTEVVPPEDVDGALARSLRKAIEHPLAGSPRRPSSIRVADSSLAAELGQVLDDVTRIVVAPTPELDELLEHMIESRQLNEGSFTYLADDRISPECVEALFLAGELLYDLAPWKTATDSQVLRMDIPELGVDGACLSIIGNLGQSRGLLVFPSLEGYDRFAEAASTPPAPGRRMDLGTSWLSLAFEPESSLPASMQQERIDHAWTIVDPDAFPVLSHHEPDGAARPLDERDVKIVSACAHSLCALLINHPHLFDPESSEPVCESYSNDSNLEVRFTAPYEAAVLFDIHEAAVPPGPGGGPRVGRNDPCPCGSGRKYKKCHLAADRQEQAGRRGVDRGHDLDAGMVATLSEFAMDRLGDEWLRFAEVFADAPEVSQLSIPWSVYHHEVQGTTVLDLYLREHGQRLTEVERVWLEAQKVSWLSVWEVTAVDPGVSVRLHDLLSGETRLVHDVGGSRTLVVRDAILAYVVDHEGKSLLCGTHPRPLPPFVAAEVVRRARGRLRRKRDVPVERLRDAKFGRYLIRRWEEFVEELDSRPAFPSRLQNTDGDDLLLTTDHYVVTPGSMPAVGARLAAMECVQPPDDESPGLYVFLRSGRGQSPRVEDTVIGTGELSGRALRLAANSVARADALRKRVETACGKKIRHRAREHSDPLSSQAAPPSSAPEVDPSSPEVQELLLDYKRRHYEDWADHALPALGGKTPREAVRTVKGRAAVDVLLKDMENTERRADRGTRFDFTPIRRELRLDP